MNAERLVSATRQNVLNSIFNQASLEVIPQLLGFSGRHGPHDTSAFRNEMLLNGQKGCYAIGKERALAMKSRISTTELKSRTSHVERLICWLETLLIQMLLSLTLWPLKLIYNRPMEAWWVWDTNRKLCMLDQRFC